MNEGRGKFALAIDRSEAKDGDLGKPGGIRRGESPRCRDNEPTDSPSDRFSMSSVLLAKTEDMFGEASSDRPEFGDAGSLRFKEVGGG